MTDDWKIKTKNRRNEMINPENFDEGDTQVAKEFKDMSKEEELSFQQGKLQTQKEILEMIRELNEELRKNNTIWRLNGDELNDLWEETLIQKIEELGK